MEFFEKLGEAITAKGQETADKAKKLAEIAGLKSRISTCEEVIRNNYLEIGRLFVEQYGGEEEAPFEKQRRAINNAQLAVKELEAQIRKLKGL